MQILKALLQLSEAEHYEFEHDVKKLLQGHSFFHEIPLISRVHHETALLKQIHPRSGNHILLNCAVFYLHELRFNIRQILGQSILDQHLFCLSYPDMGDTPEERVFKFNIPNLCVVHATAKQHILNLPILTPHTKHQWLLDILHDFNLQHGLTLHYSQSHPSNASHLRYYLIFKF